VNIEVKRNFKTIRRRVTLRKIDYLFELAKIFSSSYFLQKIEDFNPPTEVIYEELSF
jgi:hypothetical protein